MLACGRLRVPLQLRSPPLASVSVLRSAPRPVTRAPHGPSAVAPVRPRTALQPVAAKKTDDEPSKPKKRGRKPKKQPEPAPVPPSAPADVPAELPVDTSALVDAASQGTAAQDATSVRVSEPVSPVVSHLVYSPVSTSVRLPRLCNDCKE